MFLSLQSAGQPLSRWDIISFKHCNGSIMASCFLLLLHVNPTSWHFLLLLCGDPEKNSRTGGWSSQCSQHPRCKLFRWFCCRNSCSCCYVSTRCGKNPAADRGFSPNLASFTCIYLYRVRPLHFTPPPSPLYASFPFLVFWQCKEKLSTNPTTTAIAL